MEKEVMLKTQQTVFTQKGSLKRRVRYHEVVIQWFLFLCGALSILITFGIVYELGKESLLFFGKPQWEDTEKPLAVDINGSQTQFEVKTEGSKLKVDQIIRVDSEVMRILAIDGTILTVERGYQNTLPISHTKDAQIKLSLSVTLINFFTGTEWSPNSGQFGILPLANATLMTSVIAIIVAIPLGLGIAIFLSEYASRKVRDVIKPVLEILAGIPTVVFGFFALTFVTPILRGVLGKDVVDIYNNASAGIVIGILILPLITSMTEDALSAVPTSLREAAYGLGATKLETAVKVVLPAAFSGIAAACIVGISRAFGETMVVAIAAGSGPFLTFNPFKGAETMTGHIVRISGGDLPYDSVDYNSLFAIGLFLFFITLVMNIISQWIVKRFREVYE